MNQRWMGGVRKTANSSKRTRKGRQQPKTQKLFERRRETRAGEPTNESFSGVSVDLLALTFDPNSDELPPNFKRRRGHSIEVDSQDESEDEPESLGEDSEEEDSQEEEEVVSVMHKKENRGTENRLKETIPSPVFHSYTPSFSTSPSPTSLSSTTNKGVPPSPAAVSKAMQQMNDLVPIPPSYTKATNHHLQQTKRMPKSISDNHNFNADGIIVTDEYENIAPASVLIEK